MRARSNRALRRWLRDVGIGALAFLMLPLIAVSISSTPPHLSVSDAAAGEAIATRAVEVTAPAGPEAENAIVAAAQLRPASDPLLLRRVSEFVVAGLSFSLLFAFNMALWRHLRRVNAAARRKGRHGKST